HHDYIIATSNQSAGRGATLERAKLGIGRIHGAGDVSDLRVDKFESVPPSEFYELLLRATPEQMAALGMQFNEQPTNVHTANGVGMFFQAWGELDAKAALQGAFR